MMMSPIRSSFAFAVLLASLSVALAQPAPSQTVDQGALIQLVEYVGADYVNAVQDGRILSEGEYAEMREFAGRLVEGIAGLPSAPGQAQLQAQADELVAAVQALADTQKVGQLAQQIRHALIDIYGIPVLPRAAPDMAAASALYQTHCASCHGASGAGDGPAASGLQPPPIDFHDLVRHDGRSLLGLYTTITQGVDETSMLPFQNVLSDEERWALAFYSGSLAVTDTLSAQGERALRSDSQLRGAMDLATVIGKAPADIRAQYAEPGYAALGYLRLHPEALFSQNSFIALSRARLDEAGSAYAANDIRGARTAALSAYLDGFEMIERQLAAVDNVLMRDTERRFMTVRTVIEGQHGQEELNTAIAAAHAALDQVGAALGGAGLSPAATFSASFFILFREGLEALLIVAALLAFTRKAGAQRATRYIHLGWIAAMVAGLFTWVLATYLINFSGASREVTEGVGGVLAAVILFYVGFWMHSNSNSRLWLGYIKGQVDKAVAGGTMWALVFIAFISVYRELFETILFYQALWSQGVAATQAYLVYGLLAAIAALVLVGIVIFRIGMRLPLGLFFKATGAVLLVLSVILLGKGIAALQEAGWLSAAYLDLPTFTWLGFFPTLQGMLAQLLMAVLAIVLWRRSSPAKQ